MAGDLVEGKAFACKVLETGKEADSVICRDRSNAVIVPPDLDGVTVNIAACFDQGGPQRGLSSGFAMARRMKATIEERDVVP